MKGPNCSRWIIDSLRNQKKPKYDACNGINKYSDIQLSQKKKVQGKKSTGTSMLELHHALNQSMKSNGYDSCTGKARSSSAV